MRQFVHVGECRECECQPGHVSASIPLRGCSRPTISDPGLPPDVAVYMAENGAMATLDARRPIDEQIPRTVRQAEIRETDRGYCIARSVTKLKYGEKRLGVFDAATWPASDRLWFMDKGEAELGMETLKAGKIPAGYLPAPHETHDEEDDDFVDFAPCVAATDDDDDWDDDEEGDDW